MGLQGRRAIVTGAASGIGRATAARLAAEGAEVLGADRDAAGLASLSEACGVQTAVFDAADPASCTELVDRATQGGAPLDILCNIAGVLDMAPVADLDPERWARIIAINLSGPFHLSRAALPHLAARRGCIVNMASTAGLVGVPFNAGYCASKHGLVGLTKAMALEFSNQSVRVNAICPTGVRTPMVAAPAAPRVDWDMVMRSAPWLDRSRLCEPEEVADAVVFLASDQARMITGVALPVDGGQVAG
jgi:meso-butanediol dehydrogenase / (S,S)-butanediol dehydrogenase / diacetyl reductase